MRNACNNKAEMYRFETIDGQDVPCMVISARHRRLGDSDNFAIDEQLRLPDGKIKWQTRGGNAFLNVKPKPYTEKYAESEAIEIAENIRRNVYLLTEYVTFVCLPDDATVRSLIVESGGKREVIHEAQFYRASQEAVNKAIYFSRNGTMTTITECEDVNAVRPYRNFIDEAYVKLWMKRNAREGLAVVVEETQDGIYSCLPAVIERFEPRLGRIYLSTPPLYPQSSAFFISGKNCSQPTGQTRMLPPATNIVENILAATYHDAWIQKYGHLLDALRQQEQIPFDEIAAFGERKIQRPWLAHCR